jgi:hypothetical protein
VIPQLKVKAVSVILAFTQDAEDDVLTAMFDVCGVAATKKDANDISLGSRAVPPARHLRADY